MVTIGQQATRDANQYYGMYLRLAKEFGTERAKNLAEHDFYVRKIVAEFALEQLREMIQEDLEERKLMESLNISAHRGIDEMAKEVK